MKPVVAALIFDKGKLLLILHKKLHLWMPVAGHVETGESNKEALKREVKEEVGLDVAIAKRPFFMLKESRVITPHYICKVKKGKTYLKKDEIKAYKWFSKKEIESSNLNKQVKKIALMAFKKS